METKTIRTAYGISTIYNADAKRNILGRVSNAMSIRNLEQREFSKELHVLLLKYKL